jgi:hypothetical protein
VRSSVLYQRIKLPDGQLQVVQVKAVGSYLKPGEPPIVRRRPLGRDVRQQQVIGRGVECSTNPDESLKIRLARATHVMTVPSFGKASTRGHLGI